MSRSTVLAILLGSAVLLAAAIVRSPEYDEGYTIFLAAGHRVPAWPTAPFTAGSARTMFEGGSTMAGIAGRLAASDVHPPLYFWAVAAWRGMVGGGWVATRLFSVPCGAGALVLVACIARRLAVSPTLAVLFTAGCYGFAYTGSVARGFALAQVLGLAAVWLALDGRAALAGALVGLAAGANDLAGFDALPVAWALGRRGWAPMAVGLALTLPLPAAFFWAQHDGRAGQFDTLDAGAATWRVARDQMAAVFGGLPLYAGGWGGAVSATLAGLAAWAAVAVVRRGHWFGVLAAGAVSPGLGLGLLALLSGSMPIELRYFAFGLPFCGLLMAAGLARARLRWAVLAVQAASLAGLLTRPETMQPQARAARAAAEAGELVLLPRGNDGVGIPGPFLWAAPDGLRVLLVRATDTPEMLRARVAGEPRVTVARLGLDTDSRAALATLGAVFGGDCWRAWSGDQITTYENTSEPDAHPHNPLGG